MPTGGSGSGYTPVAVPEAPEDLPQVDGGPGLQERIGAGYAAPEQGDPIMFIPHPSEYR